MCGWVAGLSPFTVMTNIFVTEFNEFGKSISEKLNLRFVKTPAVGIIGIVILLKYENELELVTNDISFNSVVSWQSKFVFKFICLATISNLFPFEVTQKCQYTITRSLYSQALGLHPAEWCQTTHLVEFPWIHRHPVWHAWCRVLPGRIYGECLEPEQADGKEIMAWIAAQPWCSGDVGMCGHSWGGINSLMMAFLKPPALKVTIQSFLVPESLNR